MTATADRSRNFYQLRAMLWAQSRVLANTFRRSRSALASALLFLFMFGYPSVLWSVWLFSAFRG